MKALQITGYGEVKDNLQMMEVDKPAPKAHQVLIEIKAASINPIDYKIVDGALKQVMKLDFPAPIGFDVSGVVTQCGADVKDLKVGDEVFSRVPTEDPGTIAEYIAVDASVVRKRPENLDFKQAASLPLVGLTTMQVFQRANVRKGDKVLIHAGSGGIGTFARQYAKTLGAYVYTTASTKNVDWVKDLGADRVIDYKKEDYKNIVEPLDMVYDTLGEQYTAEAFEVVKEGGHVVSIAGPLDDETANNLGLNAIIRFILKLMRLKVTMKAKKANAHYSYLLMNPDGDQLGEIKRLAEAGKIKPVLDQVFPFEKSIEAMQYLKDGHSKGKVVISMEG